MSLVTYGVTVLLPVWDTPLTYRHLLVTLTYPMGRVTNRVWEFEIRQNLFLRRQAKKIFLNLATGKPYIKAFSIAIIMNNEKAGHLEKLQKATETLR